MNKVSITLFPILPTYLGKVPNLATWLQSWNLLSSMFMHFRLGKFISLNSDNSFPPNCKSSRFGKETSKSRISFQLKSVWLNESVLICCNANSGLGGVVNLRWLKKKRGKERWIMYSWQLKNEIHYLSRKIVSLGSCEAMLETVSQSEIRLRERSKSSISIAMSANHHVYK